MKALADEAFQQRHESLFITQGGTLCLSNRGQLELLRAALDRGVPLRTTVRGFSMHPFIRDQDVLTIVPMNGRSPSVGDVVAFIHPETGRLVIHRLIARKGSSWLVRGDNCPEPDGLVGKEIIIGYVARVERRGREVHLGFGVGRSWIAVLNRGNGLVRLKYLWYMPRRAAGFALRYIQTLSPYRTIARHMAPRFSVLEANENDLFTVHRMLSPFALSQKQPQNPNVTNWVARRKNRVIGFVQYVYHPEAHYPWVGHWLFSLHVRAQYRGLGLGETLTRCVIDQAVEKGALALFLAVNEDNRRAIRLYGKLGFEQSTLQALEPLFREEKQRSGRRRIVMRRPLVTNPQQKA